jgi:uroporphyrinogen decarboxylase
LSAPFYQEQLDELQRILDAVAGECLVITTLFGPFASGNHASGDLVTAHVRADPEPVSQGLAAIADSLAEFALACVAAGAAGIYYSAQGGEADRFTKDEFVCTIKPHDLTVLDAVKDQGEFHLLHICRDRVRASMRRLSQPRRELGGDQEQSGLQEGRELFQRTSSADGRSWCDGVWHTGRYPCRGAPGHRDLWHQGPHRGRRLHAADRCPHREHTGGCGSDDAVWRPHLPPTLMPF